MKSNKSPSSRTHPTAGDDGDDGPRGRKMYCGKQIAYLSTIADATILRKFAVIL